MKARLAKKIAHTPINRLSPRWLDRFIRSDERIYEAVREWSKKSRKKTLKAGNKNVNIKT